MTIRPLSAAFCVLSLLVGSGKAQFEYQFEEASTGEILALLELSTLPATELSHIQSFQILERVGESPFEFGIDVSSYYDREWFVHSVQSPVQAEGLGLNAGELIFLDANDNNGKVGKGAQGRAVSARIADQSMAVLSPANFENSVRSNDSIGRWTAVPDPATNGLSIVAPNLPVSGDALSGLRHEEGSGNLFTGTDPFRSHQLYRASDFNAVPEGGAWIVAFADRADESQQEEVTLNYEDVHITLSTTDTNSLSRTYVDNIGNDATTVIDGARDVTYTVSPSGPNEFSGVWNFDEPFFYDPQQGNLLVDFASSSGAASFNLDIQDVDYIAQTGGDLDEETGSYGEQTSIIEQFVFVNEDQLCIPLLGNSLPLSGDLDLDGEVAFSDFLILSANFGETGGYVDGDINCSDTVDFADFLALSNSFGAKAKASAVPEPSGIGLTMCGSIAALAFRRRRRSARQTKPRRTVRLPSITKSGERLESRLLLTSVVGVSPDGNAQVVSKTAQISIEFDVDINPTTATANSFEIRSSQTVYSIHPPQVSGRHVSISLLGEFNEGEVIHVTATQGITSIAGAPLEAPFVWQFRTATSGDTVDDGGSHVGSPTLVSDINLTPMQSGTGDSNPQSAVELNGDICYVANNGDGNYLWHTNRTTGETQRLSDTRVGWHEYFFDGVELFEYDLVKIEDSFYFVGDDGTNGRQLWKSDGTIAGTIPLKNFQPNNDDSTSLRDLTKVDGTLYFVLQSGENRELWKYNVTNEEAPEKLTSWTQRWPPDPLFISSEFQGSLFFTRLRGRLWTSDGTVEGTHFLKEASFDRPCFDGKEDCHGPTYNTLTPADKALYFATDVLWKTDGTIEGTVQLTDEQSGFTYPSELTSVGETLFFVNGWNDRSPHGGRGELWKSDGTSEGTVLVKDIYSGDLTSDPQDLTNVEGVLYFSADDGLSGRELWRSDGTSEGTRRVKDIWSGTGSSNPTNLHNVNGQLWFSAENGAGGAKLWTSDGTESGTQLVEGPVRAPDDFILVDDELYFTAWTEASGRELWSLRLNPDEGTGGDLDGDGKVAASDIDLLFAAIRDSNSDARFDLDSNGEVDKFDVTFLTETLLRTFGGDVNLDGQVAFDDFLVLSANYEKGNSARRADGDLNGDGTVGFDDFLMLSADFGKERSGM